VPETPLERPVRSTVVRSYASILPAEPAAVFAVLIAHLPEGAAVDDARQFAAVQGGWWYRSEYAVLADEEGARIEHEIVNVAAPFHWLGPITGRAEIAASPYAFQDLLTAMADDLGL